MVEQLFFIGVISSTSSLLQECPIPELVTPCVCDSYISVADLPINRLICSEVDLDGEQLRSILRNFKNYPVYLLVIIDNMSDNFTTVPNYLFPGGNIATGIYFECNRQQFASSPILQFQPKSMIGADENCSLSEIVFRRCNLHQLDASIFTNCNQMVS